MTVVAEHPATVRRRTWLDMALTFARRQPLGTFGLLVVIVAAAAGLSAEWIAPYSPTANDFAVMTEPPSAAHWLGTDQFGRDLLSRIIYGARTALIIGFVSALVGGFAGENDLDVAHAPLAEKSMDLPRADESEWVVVLEGSDAGAVGAAARATFTLPRLKPFGVTAAPSVGTYRLLFGNQR